ncbi:MAG TPA: TadE/TadG family type IV pilus assembly protein [Propionibacteriaceae bacterium]|nr:TadE/TadG family type IV pilus assembly protein [Propionibacteriaceae bacterium]
MIIISGTRQRRRDQRGSATVEITILVPALLLTLSMLVVGGRVWFARTTVNEAAHAAARAASLARAAGEAGAAGRSAGAQSLATGGLRCASTTVEVNTAAFGVPVGTPATVTSTVNCRVGFADLLLPGLPGSVDIQASGASALDTYRSR